MIPAGFDYSRAASAEEALSLLAEHGDEAKLLAGGHSLLPLMKLRLAQPERLIDIGGVADLSYLEDRGDTLPSAHWRNIATSNGPPSSPSTSRCWPMSPLMSATLRSATGGPSAVRSPTVIRHQTSPLWPWRRVRTW